MRSDPVVPSLQPPQTERRTGFASSAPVLQPQEILVVEEESAGARHAVALRRSHHVVMITELAAARQYLNKALPSLVVADIDAQNGAGVDFCATAKSLATPATVLLIMSDAKSVPDVLLAGCDAILLKPFAENLLYGRIGRLLRSRAEQVRLRARNGNGGYNGLDLAGSSLATTNRAWPETPCPSCSHGGATSFEFSSHRRSWYACLVCKNVWLGKRQE